MPIYQIELGGSKCNGAKATDLVGEDSQIDLWVRQVTKVLGYTPQYFEENFTYADLVYEKGLILAEMHEANLRQEGN